jgi:hypothetical protein
MNGTFGTLLDKASVEEPVPAPEIVTNSGIPPRLNASALMASSRQMYSRGSNETAGRKTCHIAILQNAIPLSLSHITRKYVWSNPPKLGRATTRLIF